MSVIERKGLPTSLENERLVLGISLLEPETLAGFRGMLDPQDFSTEQHRRIWTAICGLYDEAKHVDRITVANELQRRGQLEAVGFSYIVGLDDNLPHVYEIDSYVSEVKTLGLCRRAIGELYSAADHIAEERTAESLQKAESLLRELNGEAAAKIELSSLDEMIRGGMSVQDLISPRAERGIPTPWPCINRFYRGFVAGKLVIMAARTSTGKSVAAAQVAVHAAAQGYGTAVFSLEMAREEWFSRIFQQACGLTPSDRLHSDERRILQSVATDVATMPLYISDKMSTTVAALRTAVQRKQARRPIGLVVVDYLQLLRTTTRRSNRVEEVSEISRALKVAARETNACWLVLAQLNREADKDGGEPRLSHLRESGSIEQDADDVIFLHMKDDDKRTLLRNQCPVPMRMIVAKQRNGQIGAKGMTWNPQYLRIEESPEEMG